MRGAAVLALLVAVVAAHTRVQTLRAMWDERVDTSHDDVLSIEELDAFLRMMDSSSQPTVEQCKALLLEFDTDHDGVFTWKDFLSRAGVKGTEEVVDDFDPPTEVHISLGNSLDSIVVQWVTDHNDTQTIVQYGTSAGALNMQTTGTTTTYDFGDLGWHHTIHKVVLTGLAPLTHYYYRAGDPKAGWSQVFHFTTRLGGPQRGVYAIYGDMGTVIPFGKEVVNSVVEGNQTVPIDLVLHVGDIAYAGTGCCTELSVIWDAFFDGLQELAAFVPYVGGVGNHESYYNFTSYRKRMNNPAPWGEIPDPEDSTQDVFWFSFDHGYVHFVFMSTEHPYAPGTPQYEWLEADLAAANNSWLVLTGHRPMYSSDVDELSSHVPGAPFQQQIEPLMVKYGVDAYFCGHMHTLEQIWPVINGTVVARGTKFVNVGAPIHVVLGTGGVLSDDKFVNPQPTWSAYRTDTYGYGRLTVNETVFHYEFMGLHRDIDNEFWLVKN